MPPLAKTIGTIILLAVCPTWLAAQTTQSSNSARSAGSTASPAPSNKPLFPWVRPSAPPNPDAPGSVQHASYEQPRRGETASAIPAAVPTADSPGLRTPTGPGSGTTALPPPGKSDLPPLSLPTRSGPDGSPRKVSGLPSLVTTAGSLAIVLGLFFVLAWTMRRASPRGSAVLPTDVLEVLGRAPLAARQQVYLIRCGKKLVLVHLCPEGVRTLTEIVEPEEVDRLLGLCRQTRPDSATAAFRHVFQQFAGQPTTRDFVSGNNYDDMRLANDGISPRTHGSPEDDYA